MRAFCFASGQIQFGRRVPEGALPIARGRDKALRDFIDGMARHGYRTETIGGRRTKVPGTERLLVPGIPEADNQANALDALHAWMKWIAAHAPDGVRVLSS